MWGAGEGGGSDSGVGVGEGGGGFFCAKVRSVHEITRFFHPLLSMQERRVSEVNLKYRYPCMHSRKCTLSSTYIRVIGTQCCIDPHLFDAD